MPEDLARATRELADEVIGLRRAYRRDRRWLVITLAAFLAGIVVAVIIAYRLIDSNNQKFCAVVAIVASPNNPPPETERARKQVANFRQLERDLGCVKGRDGRP